MPAENLFTLDMTLEEQFDYYAVPKHLRPGLKRYLDLGVRPGATLDMILAGDVRAILSWTGDARDLSNVVLFILNCFPKLAFGSRENVEAWIQSKEPK